MTTSEKENSSAVMRIRQLGFDPASVFTGPPTHIRKKFSYIGHAATTYSVEQAAGIVDYIGKKSGCDYALPFAVRLVENGELISIAEDNGEFACGDILASCLKKVEGYNVMVCVSRRVQGVFVTDMVQIQKHRAVKEAAAAALELLHEHLTNARFRANSATATATTNNNTAANTKVTNGSAAMHPAAAGLPPVAVVDRNISIHTSSSMRNIALDVLVPSPITSEAIATAGSNAYYSIPLAAQSAELDLATPTHNR